MRRHEARERFSAIQREYYARIADWLDEGEKVINAGIAVSVDWAQEHGRGTGEGIIALTNRRVLFQFDQMQRGIGGIGIPLDEITNLHSRWIVMPRMRELFITANRDGEVTSRSFYLGKQFAKELESQFRATSTRSEHTEPPPVAHSQVLGDGAERKAEHPRWKEPAMPRSRKPQLTGPDYLTALAGQAAERDQPYAQYFANMLFQCFGHEELLLSEVIAKRPLRDYEASPVSIILAATEMAMERGDRESLDEILNVGLSLLAKWPTYLATTVEGHPDLDFKEHA